MWDNPKLKLLQTLWWNEFVECTSLRNILYTSVRWSFSHHCAIQDKDDNFYLQFQMVICGLDSVEARRWMNATLVNLVDWDDPERTLKPLIDGGTEGGTVPSLGNSSSYFRLPWTSSCHHSNSEFLLWMLSGYACQTYRLSCLHYRHYAATTWALYRVGFCVRMASPVSRYHRSLSNSHFNRY